MGGKSSKFDAQNNDSIELNKVFNKQQNDEEKNKENKKSIITPGVDDKAKKDEPQEASCIKRIITIIITVVTLAESIYSTYIAYKAYEGFGNLSDQIKLEVTDKYGYRMIQDIKADRACNGEWEPLFMYIFKGTNSRCDCRKTGGDITSGFCMNDQQNCRYIGFLKEMVLSVWPFGINDKVGTQLCFKNYMADTFATVSDWPKTCRSGQKRCGGQSAKSMLCVNESEMCPINSIIVAQTNPNPAVYNEQMVFNSTHILFYSRQSDNQPLNYNKVTSGEGPCYDTKQENTYEGREDHFTYKEIRKVCEVDPRWDRVAEVGEYTLFKSGDIIPEEYFKEIWDENPISDKYRYGFYVSHYPDWKYEKRNLISKITTFVEKREFIMQYQTALLGLCAASLAMNVFIGIKVIHHFLTSGDEATKQQFDKKKDAFSNMVKISQIAACVYQIINIKSYVQAFEECVANSVSDNRTNGILKMIGDYLNDKVYVADKNLIISNCVGLVFTILSFLYNLYQMKKNKK